MANLLRAAALLLASAVLPSCATVDALNATISTGGLTVTRNIAYRAGARGGMDVYRPEGAGKGEKGLPLVVFFYGGSWQGGSKDDYKFVAAPLAQAGLVVAVPDYRVYPEVMYPDFLRDCAEAVAYARAHAAEWGADPRRLYLMGHSAGGYNVLMLATDPAYLQAVGLARSDVAGVIALAGPADFFPIKETDIREVFAPAVDSPLTQPINHVDGQAPPMLLLHGDSDSLVYPRNSIALAAKVKAAGGDVTLKLYPGVGHVGIVTSVAPLFSSHAPVRADVLNFIRTHGSPSP
jgi:acetyl esterase/lipase